MAFLPSTALTLQGGCFCSAIRYSAFIPSLEYRPLAPGCLPVPISSDLTCAPAPSSEAANSKTVPCRLPFIELDHCHSCRRACGSLLQSWLICEAKWIKFSLLPRDDNLGSVGHVTSEQREKMVRYEAMDVVKPSKELQTKTYLGHYSSNGESERTFCTRCGTPMTFHFSGNRGPQWKLDPLVDIALGTLDQESLEKEGVRPERHGWWEDGTSWVRNMLYKGTGPLVRHPTGSPGSVLEEDRGMIEVKDDKQSCSEGYEKIKM